MRKVRQHDNVRPFLLISVHNFPLGNILEDVICGAYQLVNKTDAILPPYSQKLMT